MLVLVVLFYLSTSVNWNEFVTNFDNIRMEYFLLSTLFAIFAFIAEALVWHAFLKPLSKESIRERDIVSINFVSVIARVIIPSGGAVDAVVKLKYMTQSKILLEKLLSSIIAVRVIFLTTQYPTMVVLTIALVDSHILEQDAALLLTVVSFLGITVLSIFMALLALCADRVIRRILPAVLYPFRRSIRAIWL